VELMSLYEVRDLDFSYGRKKVLNGLKLEIAAGGIVALLGPNGSGKSTLLKLLLGLLKPERGTVALRGRELVRYSRRELAREVAYVPQVHREAFGYTVREIVLMGRMASTPFLARYGARDLELVEEALEKLEIAHLSDRPYTQISGGERQLALIARAIAQGASTFIMDEPTNNLDYGNQIRLLERIARLAVDGHTFLMTTHHPDHALSIADRVVLMKQGTILRDGPASSTITPRALCELYDLRESMLGRGPGNGSTPHFRMERGCA
jgi:iron complex transport system ATP-binding protein